MRVASVGALDPHVVGEVAEPKYPLHPASGPISVHIEYTVPEQHAREFIAVVNELGRIRRRDGAFNWSVAQDIDRPEQWIEQFESPTWIDYLRRQTRPTLADAGVRERLRSLISGERGSVLLDSSGHDEHGQHGIWQSRPLIDRFLHKYMYI